MSPELISSSSSSSNGGSNDDDGDDDSAGGDDMAHGHGRDGNDGGGDESMGEPPISDNESHNGGERRMARHMEGNFLPLKRAFLGEREIDVLKEENAVKRLNKWTIIARRRRELK